MPFKSKAQRRKFAELLVKGEISPETYEEWNRSTGSAELPERVQPKAGAKSTRKAKASRPPTSKPRTAKAKTKVKAKPKAKSQARRKPASRLG